MINPFDERPQLLARLSTSYNDGLLERGLEARAREKFLQEGSTSPSLRESLLNYAIATLSSAVDAASKEDSLSTQLFISGGQAIECSASACESDRERSLLYTIGALAYHLGSMNARAYVMARSIEPTEHTMVGICRDLLLRDFSAAKLAVLVRLNKQAVLPIKTALDLEIAKTSALDCNFAGAVASLFAYLASGDKAFLDDATDRARKGATVALSWGYLSEHLILDLAYELFANFGEKSLHRILPRSTENPALAYLRDRYIDQLSSASTAQVDLWPSQIEPARRAFDENDDLIVALPTSAGKTRIAELCMLPALAERKDVVYVTPLRALAAQVERQMMSVFGELGFSISTVYSERMGVSRSGTPTVYVLTPEKLDFAMRRDSDYLRGVGLVILDEAHMIGTSRRELGYEILIQRLRSYKVTQKIRLVALSALFSNDAQGLLDFSAWIHGATSEPLVTDWKPTRRTFGVIRWRDESLNVEIETAARDFEITHFIRPEQKRVGARSRKPRAFPKASDTNESVVAAAFRIAATGQSVLVYSPLKSSVLVEARCVISLLRAGAIMAPDFNARKHLSERDINLLDEWLGTNHDVTQCLLQGIAIHHGDLPREVLNIVERLIADKGASIIFASPSIAQGINVSASTIILRGLGRFNPITKQQDSIPVDEFLNVIGRAGRAFADIEGQVLLYVDPARESYLLEQWNSLRRTVARENLESGLLRLINDLIVRVGGTDETAISILTERANITQNLDGNALVGESSYDQEIDDLDDALATILHGDERNDSNIAEAIDRAMQGSLFERGLSRRVNGIRDSINRIVSGRSAILIKRYTPSQRRLAFLTGVRTRQGPMLESLIAEVSDKLVDLAEKVPRRGIELGFVNNLTEIGLILLHSGPYQSQSGKSTPVPIDEETILSRWLQGVPLARIASESDAVMAYVDDSIRYRIVWAIRGILSAVQWDGEASVIADLVQYGVPNIGALRLMQHRVQSRGAGLAISRLIPFEVSDDGIMEWVVGNGDYLSENIGEEQQAVLRSYLLAYKVEPLLGGSIGSIEIAPKGASELGRFPLAFAFQGGPGIATITDAHMIEIGSAILPSGFQLRASGERGRVEDGRFHFWRDTYRY